jgi:hypothetical protein
MDRVRRHRRLREALQDELELARIGGHVADGEHARKVGPAGRGIDRDVAAVEPQPPLRDGPEFHRQAEEGQQVVRRHRPRFALERRQHHAREARPVALQRAELVGHGHLDLAARRRLLQPRGALRRGAEFGTAVHHGDPGDALERQRPVHRRVAAARDHHALAGELLPPRHHVAHRAGALVPAQPVERRPVRAEGAGARRHDHGARAHRVSLRGAEGEIAIGLRKPFHPPSEQVKRREGRRLPFQPLDQHPRVDRRVRRDVVDRLFRVQRRALAADRVERVDHRAAHPQHPALEDREKPDRPGADDRNIRLDRGRHQPRPSNRPRR